MTQSDKYTLSSFDGRLIVALLKGARERVVLPLESHARAISLRHRMQQLRTRMKRVHHPDWPLTYRCIIREPQQHDKGWHLILEPRDSEFTSAFKAAGIEAPALEDDPLLGFDLGNIAPDPDAARRLDAALDIEDDPLSDKD